jgi:hypothetical protein
MSNYCKRIWLNPKQSASTGSVVVFDGKATWGYKKPEHTRFLELSDCHGKVKLHQCKFETKKTYIKKIKLLYKTIGKYIEHLEES